MSDTSPTDAAGGGTKLVLDESLVSGSSKDHLADIRPGPSQEGGSSQFLLRGGEKVELDRADLPQLGETPLVGAGDPILDEPPSVEVDLAGEDVFRQVETLEDGERADKKTKLVIGTAAGLALCLGAALGLFFWLRGPALFEKPDPHKPGQLFIGDIPKVEEVLWVHFSHPFIVDLIPGQGGRVLRVIVNLEATTPLGRKDISEKRRLCRDIIYRILVGRPAGELKNARGKKLLRAQIKSELNHALARKLVARVYFSEFVITG